MNLQIDSYENLHLYHRWTQKILIYDYNKDIQGKHQSFIADICKNLDLDGYDQTVPLQDKIFSTHNKPKLKCNDANLNAIIKTQVEKFKQITQGWQITIFHI